MSNCSNISISRYNYNRIFYANKSHFNKTLQARAIDFRIIMPLISIGEKCLTSDKRLL